MAGLKVDFHIKKGNAGARVANIGVVGEEGWALLYVTVCCMGGETDDHKRNLNIKWRGQCWCHWQRWVSNLFWIVGFIWAQVANIDVIGENIAAVNVIEKLTFNCRQFKFHILGSNLKFVIWMFDQTNVSHDVISYQSILLPLLYKYYMTSSCNCGWFEAVGTEVDQHHYIQA